MAGTDCVFCRIRDRTIPSTFLYEDERAFVIRDIQPKASTHLLIIPKEHVPTVASLAGRKLSLMGHLTGVANRMAQEQGVAGSGFRLVINCGPDSGMEVGHLHIHLLAGHRLGGMA
ncbi:MAG: histidine triad nucleotide-binding protein [Chloroflexi bacterium]|nr:histidine triad nucleotide-binding protein [Chloroflexota bacterium]